MTLHTALPLDLGVAPDSLEAQIQFFSESVRLITYDKNGAGTVKMVSAMDVAKTLSSAISLDTGLLPPDTLWWAADQPTPLYALWQKPRKWKVALQLKPFEPAERLEIPMPGLIFICQAGRPPRIFAAKKRPVRYEDRVYKAPLFNVFNDGRSCPGNHKYPVCIPEIPESFFLAFFTLAGDSRERSKKHPKDLADLWHEINGTERFPTTDLVPCGNVAQIIGMK
ncbi:MAG: hypothetical protein Q7K03_07860 [Dehalococcoidia bacterium]|nr:hypothetical protein [Dehalococcoidia bacterium]